MIIDAVGRLDLFAKDTDNAIWHVRQAVPNGGWGAWQSLGGSLDGPAVGRNLDGSLEVFAVGTNSVLYHDTQQANGTWSGWSSMGVYAQGVPTVGRNADGGSWSGWASYGGTTSSRMPDVTVHRDGRMEVFTAGVNDRVLYHAAQVAPSTGWTGWFAFSGIGVAHRRPFPCETSKKFRRMHRTRPDARRVV